MATLVVFFAVLIFVMVYVSLWWVTSPADRDLQRRADENAQDLLERRRKRKGETSDLGRRGSAEN